MHTVCKGCITILTVDNSSKFAKLAWLLLTVALTLFLCGYVSMGWISGTDKREQMDNITQLTIGLWKTCYNDYTGLAVCQKTTDFLLEDWNDNWLPGTQAILSTAFAFELGSVAVMWTYVILPQYQEGPLLIFISACSSFAAATLLTLGVIIFGIQQGFDTTNFYETQLDWAYDMTVVASGFTGISCFLLVGDFYDILQKISKKKALSRQSQVLEALDQATIETHNTSDNRNSRSYSRASDQESEHKNTLLDSSSPLYKSVSKANLSGQSLECTASGGIVNHTYESAGEASDKESDVTCVRIRRQNERLYDNNVPASSNDGNFVNDNSKPSTSSANQHVYDNHVAVNKSNLPKNDAFDSKSNYDSDQNTPMQKHINDMFDVANSKPNTTSTNNKTTPVSLFQALDPPELHENRNPIAVCSGYSTHLPPLGKAVFSRASYDTSIPKTSWHYNQKNELVKSTPTNLFLTNSSKSETNDSNLANRQKAKTHTQTFSLAPPVSSSQEIKGYRTYDEIDSTHMDKNTPSGIFTISEGNKKDGNYDMINHRQSLPLPTNDDSAKKSDAQQPRKSKLKKSSNKAKRSDDMSMSSDAFKDNGTSDANEMASYKRLLPLRKTTSNENNGDVEPLYSTVIHKDQTKSRKKQKQSGRISKTQESSNLNINQDFLIDTNIYEELDGSSV